MLKPFFMFNSDKRNFEQPYENHSKEEEIQSLDARGQASRENSEAGARGKDQTGCKA